MHARMCTRACVYENVEPTRMCMHATRTCIGVERTNLGENEGYARMHVDEIPDDLDRPVNMVAALLVLSRNDVDFVGIALGLVARFDAFWPILLFSVNSLVGVT